MGRGSTPQRAHMRGARVCDVHRSQWALRKSGSGAWLEGNGNGVEDWDNPDSFPVQARSRSVAHSNEQKAAA